MPTGSAPEHVGLLESLIKWATPFFTFVLGFLVSRFTMSKKERKDHEAKLVETANKLTAEQARSFQEFTTAFHRYINKQDAAGLDDFFEIATKGELYFDHMRQTCDAVLANNVDKTAVTNSIYPKVKDAVERTLPDFYSTLQEVAQREGIQYSGELKRENYESIYLVYEKLSPSITTKQ
ncbi:hypothetical protein AN401_02690 [Zobellella denitrificans]|uniref:DUF4760 domain-containing protein n=1 Tax=Zobellella denitrificans TaxID=347534 RepID=A0A291HL30_9GAMM|nr:hypothetical protein [Zobellella denitrificans]ATG72900.1 hypothetical protein AN401_02690 [Zobellella denitrificans]